MSTITSGGSSAENAETVDSAMHAGHLEDALQDQSFIGGTAMLELTSTEPDMTTATNDGHALQRLLDELGRLPGIGPKSAQRIAYYLLEADLADARRLASAVLDVKRQVHFCPICFSYATDTTCKICSDSTRDPSTICVVSEPRDVSAIERTGVYRGLYHVLGGVISPMDKIGPGQLHIRELLARLANESVTEVILATNPDVEGETTATYLARTIAPLGVAVSRLASGLPVGGELEYADEVTLGRAIEARRILS